MPDTPANDPPRINAEDNPWYLLATVYGVPKDDNFGSDQTELRSRNRKAWNRYMSSVLTTEQRNSISKWPWSLEPEEFTPLDIEELATLYAAFVDRSNNRKSISLPSAEDLIDFHGVIFNDTVRFNFFIFPRESDWNGAIFRKEAWFLSTIFQDNAFFVGTTFSEEAMFTGSVFSKEVNFENAAFRKIAWFEKAKFLEDAAFRGATFYGVLGLFEAEFSSEANFVNTTFKDTSTFKDVQFQIRPPRFFGATLHEFTDWDGVIWPDVPKSIEAANSFVAAYARLKQEMDRLKKHEEELDFFALELQCRRVKMGLLPGFPIDIYGALSDYGRSYFRPIFWILATIVFGACAGALPKSGVGNGIYDALAFSAASTFGVFGFRRELFPQDIIQCLSPAMIVISDVQTLFGIIFIFFFGLAVRNRFRMK